MKRCVVFLYVTTLIALSIYSYSQIDPNLTLSANNLYQAFQSNLIQLGYFNRSLSLLIYIAIITSLFISYFVILKKIKSFNKITIWRLIIISGFLLLFSYSAFSHDIFNYIFDARIFTKYGLNPYSYKALDFPEDSWTRFMHWTHRTYPYGPTWLILTLPFSFLGFQKFSLTLLFFKLLFLGTYLINCYLIYGIVKKLGRQDALFSLSFFAFNPLILIESLVSPHNDSVMLLFVLLSIYLFVGRKFFLSLVSTLTSAGIKFVTLPFSLVNLYFLLKRPNLTEVLLRKILVIFLLIYFIGIIPVVYSREILPWYGIILIGLAALIQSKFVKVVGIGLSLGLPLKYISFLYQGEWTISSYNTFVITLFILVFISVFYYFSLKFKL